MPGNRGKGVYGSSTNGYGVHGVSAGGGGVLGEASGPTGNGVYGVGANGVYGIGNGSNGAGLFGQGNKYGVYGIGTGPNSFAGYFGGPVSITSNLSVNGPITASGCTGCSPPSDRYMKANFSLVNPRSVVARLALVPIQAWNYKSDSKDVRHIGPTAQDFRAAFGLGDSDKIINTVDADGVALAAIQGLYQMMQEKDRRIEQLQNRLSRLELIVHKRVSRGSDKRRSSGFSALKEKKK